MRGTAPARFWVVRLVLFPALPVVMVLERSVKDHPNPLAANVTRFGQDAP